MITDCSGEELVLLAGLIAMQIGSEMSVEEINTMITFLASVSNNLSVIVSCRDPQDIVGPL